MSTPRRLVVALSLALTGAGCAGPSKKPTQMERLAAASVELDSENYFEASLELERLLRPKHPALQRFYAAYLLTQTHERAAIDAPFLEESSSRAAFRLRGEADQGRPSQLGHFVAVTYYARLGRQIFGELDSSVSATEASLSSIAGLPPALERLGVENILASLNLSLLAAYSRLNFEERITPIVSGFPGLGASDSAQQIIEAAQVDPAVRPWIYRAIFLSLRADDEPAAYRFGVLALESSAPADAAFERAREQIIEWITEGSSYRFVSPAGSVFDPDLPSCLIDGTSNIDFAPQQR